MPTSVREQVLSAFLTMLGTVAAENVPGTIKVYRARRKPLSEDDDADQLPALVMRSGPAASEQSSAAVTRNIERITVTAMLKAGTDEALDQALSDMWAALQRAVEADPTLGGVAVDVNLADADQGAADGDGIGGVGDIFAAYDVEYWTRPGNPYAFAP
ncbi:hypothetical protein FZ983_32110 [Azospirillum sp. B21]|uniref:hypothetical protein n=1 Tax=Azospirillum sp. B21 TaxID=2607496 RepID=UPI0011F08E8E|nr:hypothetical protein [Azospirillum sp. B21]KAA0572216.1 hypothetical protein FZ983_32110 [Azospirillum sp. B21]